MHVPASPFCLHWSRYKVQWECIYYAKLVKCISTGTCEQCFFKHDNSEMFSCKLVSCTFVLNTVWYTHCISCESKTPSLNIFLIILFNVCFLIRKHLKIKFKLQQEQSRQSYCKFGLLIYSRASDKTEFFVACITTKRLIGVLDYLSGTKI